ncbi:MAG: adenosylhomocysteinase [Nitrososphaerales archaeon]
MSELLERGIMSHNWARQNMPAFVLTEEYVKKKLSGSRHNPFKGTKIAASLHVSKETSVLISALNDLGANIRLVAANPLSSQPEIISYLSSRGVEVGAKRGETMSEYKKEIKFAAESKPELIIDDGAELHVAYSKLSSRSCFGGTDETTSGTMRLRALSSRGLLRYSVFAVNEAITKHIFDNRYGTGQSAIDGLLRATGLLIAGKIVVVAGYGWVGSGVALRARGLGARVIVTEVDPIKALEAHMDGFEVTCMKNASRIGNIFLTCTGQTRVLRKEHFKSMPDKAILGNIGHFNSEIDVKALFEIGDRVEQVREGLSKIDLNRKRLYLLNQGRVINLISAEGHPPEVMQLSFSNQLLCLFYLASERPRKKIVMEVPKKIDDLVSRFALNGFNLEIDSLDREQVKYSRSFVR